MESKLWHGEKRMLHGWVVGISVSDSDDLAAHGYGPGDVNRVIVRLSEALLSAGARLVFGHDWRPDGVMDAICRIAVGFQSLPKDRAPDPLIQNLIPWPDKPILEPELRNELEQRGLLRVVTVAIPQNNWSSANYPIARAIALTQLRRRLVDLTNARVCLGGKEKNVQGFHAGVIEEAYNAAVAKHPVYVGRFLGGAAAKLVAGITHPNVKQKAFRVVEGKENQHNEVLKSTCANLVAEKDLSSGFQSESMEKASGLNTDDWQRLLNAPDIEVFSTLVIRGLGQLPKPSEKSPRTSGVQDAEKNTTAKNVTGKRPRRSK